MIKHHPRYLPPIPLDFTFEGTHYKCVALPLLDYKREELEGMPGWFSIQSEDPELKKIRAITHHPIYGWHGMNQFCNKELVAHILEILAGYYH